MKNADRRQRLSVWIPLLLFGVVIGILTVHVLNPARSARMELLRKDHERLRSVVDELRRDNQRLSQELRGLEEGTDGWREVARRDFGLIAPGEVVFRFPVRERKARTPSPGR